MENKLKILLKTEIHKNKERSKRKTLSLSKKPDKHK